jgi:hypothetical protein
VLGAVITLCGAPRNGLPFSRNVIRAGRYRRAPPSVKSDAEMVWCPRHATADTLALRGSPPARSWPLTLFGTPISQAPSQRATGSTVIRSPWPMATAAFCLAARRSHPPVCQRPSPCSPACSKRLDSRSVAVLTTACPVPPIPSPVCPSSHQTPLGAVPCRGNLLPIFESSFLRDGRRAS